MIHPDVETLFAGCPKSIESAQEDTREILPHKTVASPSLPRVTPGTTVGDLPLYDAEVGPSTTLKAIALEFECRPELPGVFLVPDRSGLPALFSRNEFARETTRAGFGELETRPASLLLRYPFSRPLVLDHGVAVADAATRALLRPEEQAFEPLLVRRADGSFGILGMRLLMLAQSQLLAQAGRVEEQLVRNNKMEAIGRLAGGVAHDFNNLLTVILANLAMVRADSQTGNPSAELLHDAENAATRAAELTHQLLSFSRQKPLCLEATDLNQCIRETVTLLRHTIDPSIHLRVKCGSDLWPIEGDANQMVQVLMNLCLNGRDAMPRGGLLLLRSDTVVLQPDQMAHHPEGRPGEFVRVRVQDTGHGMTPDVRAKIFEPFYTTKAAGKGTGLGLAMVYGIVQQHGGWIECQSVIRRGTRFDIFLPRCPARAVPVKARSEPDIQLRGCETVLLVDDEALIRNVGGTILAKFGYRTLLAQDGREAVDIFRREHGQVDLVVLDLMMPNLSGLETLQRLRAIDPHVRVLLSSGSAAAEPHEWDGLSVAGFVHKPYRPKQLASAVRDALRSAASMAETRLD